MLLIKSLILFIGLFGVFTSALLPPSPGPISHFQFDEKPTNMYYTEGTYNCIQMINEPNVTGMCTVVGAQYYPITMLSVKKYLASYVSPGKVMMAIIEMNGPNVLKNQPVLDSYGKNNQINSKMYYDDTLNSYFFISNNEVAVYNITSDTVLKTGVTNIIADINPYYDVITKTFYYLFSDSNDNKFFGLLDSNFYYSFYDVSQFNLEIPLGSYSIAAYNGSVVLFGSSYINSHTTASLLYYLDLETQTSTLLGKWPNDYKLVTGVNPRFILLISPDGTQTELFDLKTQKSETFTNLKTPYDFSVAFISSINAREIF